MIEFFIGLILGGLISWAITHWYYVRSGRDQKTLFNKLSLELKELILSDKRDSLSVDELNDLLRKSVETRAMAKEFFASAIRPDILKLLTSEQVNRLVTEKREGIWYEYLASALGAKVEPAPWNGSPTGTIVLNLRYPGWSHVWTVSRPDTDNFSSREQQIRFESLKSLGNGEIREILRELNYPVH